MFRDIITRGALVIYMELISQLEADGSTFTKKRNRARREPLLENARTWRNKRERLSLR